MIPFRKGGLLWVALISACPLLYIQFFLDGHLKSKLEQGATRLNGAKVDIGHFKTKLLSGEIEISNVQFGHPEKPMKNWLAFDNIHLTFDTGRLLRKKLLIKDVVVSGVRVLTNRDSSGSVPLGEAAQSLSYFNHVSTQLYASAKEDLSHNPLTTLVELSSGMDLRARVASHKKELKSWRTMDASLQAIVKIADEEGKRRLSLYSENDLVGLKRKVEGAMAGRKVASSSTEWELLVDEIREKDRILEEAAAAFEAETKAIEHDVTDLQASIEEDLATLHDKFNLPKINFTDLTPDIIGFNILDLVQKVAYWVDITRQYMPVRATDGDLIIVVQKEWGGTRIHYGSKGQAPTLAVSRIRIDSDAHDEEPNQGRVKATLEGLTSEPAILESPLTFDIEAAFPKLAISDFKISGKIDHTDHVPKEEFTFSGAFPLTKWGISGGHDFKFEIEKANADVQASGKFDSSAMDVKWNIDLSNVRFGIYSRYKATQDILESLAANRPAFSTSGFASGTMPDLQFHVESDFGKSLATELEKEFKTELAALNDTLRSHILDQVGDAKQQVLQKLKELRDSAPYGRLKTHLKEIKLFADNVGKRNKTASKLH